MAENLGNKKYIRSLEETESATNSTSDVCWAQTNQIMVS